MPPSLRRAQTALVHLTFHAAGATFTRAIWLDSTRPLGPSWFNPLGQISPLPTYAAALSGIITNVVLAPALSQHALFASLRAPHLACLGSRRHRNSAVLHGALGAMIALWIGILACGALKNHLRKRAAAYGWDQQAFPSCYYWYALEQALMICLPLMTLEGFYLTAELRAAKLMGGAVPPPSDGDVQLLSRTEAAANNS